MGHARVRPDNNCLNCGRTVEERYCTHCGQENIDPNESFGHLIRHFFEDFTHFDSKFYRYFQYLMTRPGFLTREYLAGRRAAWFNPIRAYIFISFVFFLVIFSGKKEPAPENKEEELLQFKQQVADDLKNTARTSRPVTAYDSLKNRALAAIADELATGEDTIRKEQAIAFSLSQRGMRFSLKDNVYKSLYEYDSVQSILPDTADAKDHGFMKWIIRTNLRLKKDYGSRRTVMLEDNFRHSVPKIMFILLPVFALYLLLFYKRRQYSQHIIFSIHYHSFIFLLYLLVLLLQWLFPVSWFELGVELLFVLSLLVYLVLALRHIYQQSFGLSLAKALGIGLLYLLTLIIVILLLALFTFVMA